MTSGAAALDRSVVAEADIVFAHDGVALVGRVARHLDLAPAGEVGPAGTGAAVREALAGRHRSVVAGLVPFDPDEPPHLGVVEEPRRLPVSTVRRARVATLDVEIPDDPAYRDRVGRALACITSGDLDKVVLARSVRLAPAPDPADLWTALLDRNPHGYVFSVRHGEDTVVGASPELVASVDATRFLTRPLAGSTPRGGDPAEDHRRAHTLLSSTKDLHEHRFVVDHITDRLGPLALDLRVPAGPIVFRTDAMLHLGTDLGGRLRPGVGALEAALTIHPTPAVCGVPHERALQTIRELEDPRGMYAGLVGWTDGRGHGCWALVLRSAVVSRDAVHVHAGAGVVAGSTPESEHAETAAKFTTVASAWAHTTAKAGASA